MKNILLVSHCILNVCSKVMMEEKELEKEYESRSKLLRLIINKNIQIIQLPCPEFTLYGHKRWGHVRDQFDNPFFKKHSQELLDPVFLQIEEYLSYPEDFKILGIVSVEGSPSCGYHVTCTGNVGGEMGYLPYKVELIERHGVFMDVLRNTLNEKGYEIPIVTMDEAIKMLRKLK